MEEKKKKTISKFKFSEKNHLMNFTFKEKEKYQNERYYFKNNKYLISN